MMAICNSMESRFIGYELQQLGVPVTFLVHEFPSSYEAEDYQQVYDYSERIIFPVEVVVGFLQMVAFTAPCRIS